MKILAVGVARSGTSFLGELFRQNPDMPYLYEPFWGSTFVAEWQCFWLTEADSRPEGDRLVQEVFAGCFDELQRQQPAPQRGGRGWTSRRDELAAGLAYENGILASKHLAVKEIRLNMHLGWVSRLVGPDLRIIHLTRDPRGVVASFLKPAEKPSLARRFLPRKGPRGGAGTLYDEWGDWSGLPAHRRFAPEHEAYGRLLGRGAAHERVAARWAVCTAHAMTDTERLAPGRYLRVRYEDLCRDPFGEASRIYDFLAETLPRPVGAWLAENTRAGNRNDRYSTSRNSLEMVDVWKTQLTRPQIRDVDTLCGPLMAALGYEAG